MVGPTSETPISHLVVPRIFMEQAREARCRHISADTVVGKRCAVTFSIGVPPLSPSPGIISRLFYSSKDTVERSLPPIEYASGSQSEFLSHGERRKVDGIFDGAVVRQNLEDAIVNRSCFSFQFALPDCLSGSVFLPIFLICCLRIRRDRGGLLSLFLLCQRRHGGAQRSEERRVGKECRSRCWPYY